MKSFSRCCFNISRDIKLLLLINDSIVFFTLKTHIDENNDKQTENTETKDLKFIISSYINITISIC